MKEPRTSLTREVSRGRRLTLVVLALSLLAPTPGDVGGCGTEARRLDDDGFFELRDSINCERCDECQLDSMICQDSCAGVSEPREFPPDCVPLVHDGEVCLRALLSASCGDYRRFVDDRAPQVPTECNFCPREAP